MENPEQALVPQAQNFVSKLFESKLDNRFQYHDLTHTLEVVRNSEFLAGLYQLTEDQKLPLILAAWFHDTGYTEPGPRPHEEISEEIALEFLNQRAVPPEIADPVIACIRATKVPQNPQSLLEEIICDADLFHLGNESFDEKNKALRREHNLLRDELIDKEEWRIRTIGFLKQHQYFTSYGKETLDPVKQKHLEKLQARVKSDKKDPRPDKKAERKEKKQAAAVPEFPEELLQLEIPKSGKRERTEQVRRTERGVVAMFRIMSENHINLSQMADSKANIMISVNTIVISILISVLLGKLQFYPEYIIPAIILVGICLAAVVFAILATRPNISGGTFTREDIQNKKINLLFFGNFYKMKLDDYDWAMKEMMKDREYLYGSMIKDMYFLGIVLARKYKFLRISYNIFMYGLVAAIVAFVIAFALSGTAG